MSHFSVLVVTDAPEEVSGALFPFDEETENLPETLLTFVDIEDEYRQKYETDTIDMVRCEDGTLAYPWDRRFQDGPLATANTEPPAHLERVTLRQKDRYASFEAFMQDFCGEDGPDPKTGRYGYWKNPKAKWDWWTMGGRWSKRLRLAPGASGFVGGSRDVAEPSKGPAVDQARFGDIDWNGMLEERRAERRASWNEAQKGYCKDCTRLGRTPDFSGDKRRYHQLLTELRAEREKIGEDEAPPLWEMISGHPEASLLRDLIGRVELFSGIPDDIYDLDTFIASTEALTTFAILKDGMWYERGQMGWFAIVANEKPDEEFRAQYDNILAQIELHRWVTVVDCHI